MFTQGLRDSTCFLPASCFFYSLYVYEHLPPCSSQWEWKTNIDSCVLELDVASAESPASISPTNIQNFAKQRLKDKVKKKNLATLSRCYSRHFSIFMTDIKQNDVLKFWMWKSPKKKCVYWPMEQLIRGRVCDCNVLWLKVRTHDEAVRMWLFSPSLF